MTMRIEVDESLCQGHARCADVAPDLFQVGDADDAKAEVLVPEVPEDQRKAAEDAAFYCPMGAITLVEG
jgi:ferredoxin